MKKVRARSLRLAPAALATVATLLAVGIASDARSQGAPPSTAEQAIKYRQSVYKVILWNFGPMAAVAQGKAPYEAQEFARRAERVAQMAPMLLEGYPAGSATGATTRARPEIWENMTQFRELMAAMEGKAKDLATVARAGDQSKSIAAFGDLGQACKNCHDKFRTD